MITIIVSDWARKAKHIPDEQFGFQKRRSTTQAAFVLMHLMQRGRLHCAFVDFEKAYDSVSHCLLWAQFCDKLCMPLGMLHAIQAMYDGAVYILQDGHKRTGKVPVSRGIKQGCPLSPLLFSLFINDMPSALQQLCPDEGVNCGERRIRCIKFADDLSLLDKKTTGLQKLLDALHVYSSAKHITVNVLKTEVMVLGGCMARRRIRQQITYGPRKTPLKEVSGFKFLGLHLTESGSMEHTMAARAPPFTLALQQTRGIAIRIRLGRHIPTRLRLASIYAMPAANYGDVIWATAFLKPKDSINNQLQRQLLCHLQQLAGVPASTPRWPLLHELGLQSMQKSWWTHIVRFYNAALSPTGQKLSPIMAEALRADIMLARQQGVSSPTWTGQVLGAATAIERSAHESSPPADRHSITERLRNGKRIPQPELMELLDAAYEAQWSAD
jgi:hypothetical protein